MSNVVPISGPLIHDYSRLSCSPEDLSYSAFLDHVRHNPSESRGELDMVRNRIPNSWIPDDSVVGCYNCKKTFNLLRRRHHCRGCGRIFCSDCSSKFIVLPRNLESFPDGPATTNWYVQSLFTLSSWMPSSLTGDRRDRRDHKDRRDRRVGPSGKVRPERVCDRCHNRFDEIYQVENAILAFRFLDLKDLAAVSRVCKGWNRAANVCRSLFRDIQYVLPGYEISPIQKQFLCNNASLLSGHSRWLVKRISSINWKTEGQNHALVESVMSTLKCGPDRQCTCWNLMCTRLCNREISGFEVLELLDVSFPLPALPIRKYLISRLATLSDDEFECILPQLTFALRREISGDSSLLDLLVERSVESHTLRVATYWNLIVLKSINRNFQTFYNIYIAKLHDRIGRPGVTELVRGRQFLKSLSTLSYQHLSSSNRNDITASLQQTIGEGVILPILPDTVVKSVDLHGVQIKNSVTSPAVVPMKCLPRDGNVPYVQRLLYKKEELIKDNIIMNVIRMMDRILQKEEKTDFCIKTYRILPFDAQSGFIEIVPDAETLYGIQYGKEAFTIQNYILEHNKHIPVADVRNRFMKSAAAYCVISYLLGVGDRHLDNIMITRDGHLFHIDYGFILGFDPRPMSPHMRITQGIVDAMGGVNSEDFILFKTYCIRIFNCLRRHTHLFMTMLSILTEDGLALSSSNGAKYEKDRLREEILSRFIPSQSSNEAMEHLLIKIDDSYRSTTPRMFMDFLQFHFRELKSMTRRN